MSLRTPNTSLRPAPSLPQQATDIEGNYALKGPCHLCTSCWGGIPAAYFPSLPLIYSIRECQSIHKYQQMQIHHICGAGKIIPLRKQLSRKPNNSKVKQLDQGRPEVVYAS